MEPLERVPSPAMARSRSPFASLLAVLGALAVVFGVIGVWASRTAGDVDSFSALAGDLLHQESIVDRLAIVIVDPVLDAAPAEVRRQRPVIIATTKSVLGDERFVPVFEGVLRRAHGALLDGDGAVHLQLAPALDAVVVEVRKLSPGVADELATVVPPSPVVISAGQADRIRSVIGFERAASWGLLIGGLILVAVAAIGSGPRALVPFGVTLAISSGLVLLLLLGIGGLVDVEVASASEDAASSAYGVLIGNLRTMLMITALVGVGSAVAARVMVRRS